MESFEREIKKHAIVINVNLIRATLNEAAEFREYLNEAIMGTEVDIIVNLSECLHLDSTFLGVLVSGYKKLKNKNRNMVIIEPTDQSRVFLTLNSIGKIFPLYDSVNSALEDIENKKMLENAVNDIEEETIEIETQPQVEAKPEELNEIQIEEVHEEIPSSEQEYSLLKEEPILKNIDLKEEINLEEEVLDNSSIENFNQEIFRQTNHQVELEENIEEEILVKEFKPLYSDENYKKGSVEWAFGFN
jgi:anti-sigma B factor antagonist